MIKVGNDQIKLTEKGGITFDTPKGEIKVCFSECIENFGIEYSVDNHRTIGTRDILAFTFTLFSTPKVEVIVGKKGFWQEKFFSNRRRREFHDLQKKINELGYATYDLT